MINLNSILATYPEWGQKVPHFPNLGRKAPPNIINNNIVNDIGNTFVNFESRFHP